MIEAGLASEFAGCTTLFAAGIAARLKGPVLWCLARRDLFAPGLLRAGLHPDRVIYAEAERGREILPLIEEGLREKGLAAAVGEVSRLGLTASRRLQVAAEAAGVTALIIRRWWTVAEKDLVHCPTAAVTRWRIAPAPSQLMPAPGLGRDRWQVELLRCRGAAPVPGSWRLAMRRVVSLYLPTWPTDRIRRRTGEPPRHEPLVTVHTIGSRRLIRSACAAAQELGLHPGMTLAQARRSCPTCMWPRPYRTRTTPRCGSWRTGPSATRPWRRPIPRTGSGSTLPASRICSAARRSCFGI